MTRRTAGPSPATRDDPPDLAQAIHDAFNAGEVAGAGARYVGGMRYAVVDARAWVDYRAATILLGNAAGIPVPEASWAPGADTDDVTP